PWRLALLPQGGSIASTSAPKSPRIFPDKIPRSSDRSKTL
ncbi:uncharacterized protein METZ01_LOCUS144596, partial [marine metagenome]